MYNIYEYARLMIQPAEHAPHGVTTFERISLLDGPADTFLVLVGQTNASAALDRLRILRHRHCCSPDRN
jgi:hypothetical protein